jgi:hypothetical protein
MLRSSDKIRATQRLRYDLCNRVNKSNRCGTVKDALLVCQELIDEYILIETLTWAECPHYQTSVKIKLTDY